MKMSKIFFAFGMSPDSCHERQRDTPTSARCDKSKSLAAGKAFLADMKCETTNFGVACLRRGDVRSVTH